MHVYTHLYISPSAGISPGPRLCASRAAAPSFRPQRGRAAPGYGCDLAPFLGLYWGYIGPILGLFWDYIGVILGLYWGYIGTFGLEVFAGLGLEV